MPDEALVSALESILLVAAEPVAVSTLAAASDRPRPEIRMALHDLRTSLQRGIRLQIHEDMAQLVTAPENTDVVQRFMGVVRPRSLSRAALEVLSVVAYRQPVTRAEIEVARGVSSDRPLQTLLARGLVEESGQRAAPGRPSEYATTFEFLEYFGLGSLDELPRLESQGESLDPESLGLRPEQTRKDPA